MILYDACRLVIVELLGVKNNFYIKILFNQTMAKLFSRKNIEFYTYPNITIFGQIKYNAMYIL